MKKPLVFLSALILSVVLAQSSNNLVATVAANKDLSTLSAAFKTAELEAMLSGEDPYTIFAPSDAAFAALPKDTLASLANDPDALTEVVMNHITDGAIMAEDVAKLDGQSITSLNNNELKVTLKDGKVMVGDAVVTSADIKAANGVIHVIDKVLLPPAN